MDRPTRPADPTVPGAGDPPVVSCPSAEPPPRVSPGSERPSGACGPPDEGGGRDRITVRLSRWSARHPWRALGMWLLFVATAVALSATVTTREATDVEAGTGPSRRAAEMLDEAGMTDPAIENVLITGRGGPPDRAEAERAAGMLADRLVALPEVADVGDPVRSASGDAVAVPVTVAGDPDDAADRIAPIQQVTRSVAADHPGLRVEQAGPASLSAAVSTVVGEDLAAATRLSLPITLGVMLLAFGALVAAAIPVLLALSAVVSTFGLYAVASYLVPDMGSVANMVMLIGMAVGVDYSLFFIRRHREERHGGRGSVDAVTVAARTAGHSIVVSGTAVIVSVSALFLVGNVLFSGLAAGAILVVGVAMVGSLTVVPALVGRLGRWVDRPRLPLLWRFQRRIAAADGAGPVSGRVVAVVLRRPAVALALAGVVVSLLALPVLTLEMGDVTLDQMPAEVDEATTLQRLRSELPAEGSVMSVVVRSGPASVPAVERALHDLGDAAVASGDLAAEGVTVTEGPDGETFELELRSVHPEGSGASRDALASLREDLVPSRLGGLAGVEWATAGQEAESVDRARQQAEALPLVGGFILAFTLVVMGVTFRSVGVVVITVLLNLASLAASFGLLVAVFQGTWAESLLGFTSNGAVVWWIPLFMLVVLVGLSMDYHVLVLSRIREGARRGASPRTAISWGMRRTAGTVVMAALVMVSVFGLFARSSVIDMKQMGVGLALAVLIDATLVRIVMLPAALAVRPQVVRRMARRW